MYNFIFYFFYSLRAKRRSELEKRVNGSGMVMLLLLLQYMLIDSIVFYLDYLLGTSMNKYFKIPDVSNARLVYAPVGFLIIWFIYRYYKPERIEKIKDYYKDKNIFATWRNWCVFFIFIVYPICLLVFTVKVLSKL